MPIALRSRQAPPPGRPATGEDIAAVAKALGHPACIPIVRLLLEKQFCVSSDIVDEAGLAQSMVSEHLRILDAAEIMTGEMERPRVYDALDPDSLLPLAALLNAVVEKDNRGELDDLIRCPPSGLRSTKSSRQSSQSSQ